MLIIWGADAIVMLWLATCMGINVFLFCFFIHFMDFKMPISPKPDAWKKNKKKKHSKPTKGICVSLGKNITFVIFRAQQPFSTKKNKLVSF